MPVQTIFILLLLVHFTFLNTQRHSSNKQESCDKVKNEKSDSWGCCKSEIIIKIIVYNCIVLKNFCR